MKTYGAASTAAPGRTVDLHVQRLKKKLGLEEHIVAIYKVGYRLVC